MVDVARRLCEDNHIQVTEIWSYHTVGDDIRFTLVHRSREVPPPVRPAARAAAPRKPVVRTAAARGKAVKPPKKTVRAQKRR
jgi:hypothetical protein